MSDNIPRIPIGNTKTPSRHLGLRRKRQTDTEPIASPTIDFQPKQHKTKKYSPETPLAIPRIITASNTVKSTPQSSDSVQPDRNCQSTGGIIRKYRLSLNKNIRDKYTRKKLVFQEHAPPDNVEEDDDNESETSTINANLEDYSNLLLLPIEEQISELDRQITNKKRVLRDLQRNQSEVSDIRADIHTWESGFRLALEMLCTLRPNYSAQQILHQLGIPDDLVEY